MADRFLQIHTLTSYGASLLNRDDAGFAKRMPFGGGVRTRISSQCQKRHWRVYAGEHALSAIDAPESIRSRESFEAHVVEPLVRDGLSEQFVRAATRKIVDVLLGSEAKKERTEKKGSKKKDVEQASSVTAESKVKTAQVTVLGKPELEYLRQLARDAIEGASDVAQVERAVDSRMKDKNLRNNIKALQPGSLEAGLGAALFGRMVTGDILARTDAAIHVAHAMTVHAQMTESDYFSALDDIVRDEGEQESGHINASELTSGVFYGYVVLDVGGLQANLGHNSALLGDVVHNLVHMIATVSPGAKKGSTAPYSYSHLVLAEAGNGQPRTLQNAFLDPIDTRGDVIANAYVAMAAHLSDLDGMYGKRERRAHAGLRSAQHFENGMTLASLAVWARDQVTSPSIA